MLILFCVLMSQLLSHRIMLTFALMGWVYVSGGEPERSGPKIYVSRVVSGSRKNRGEWKCRTGIWREEKSSPAFSSPAFSAPPKNRAQQSGALSGRSRSGERRSQKWERGAAKQPASLRSNALHRSNRVSAEKIASYIFVLIVYSHKVQLDSTTN